MPQGTCSPRQCHPEKVLGASKTLTAATYSASQRPAVMVDVENRPVPPLSVRKTTPTLVQVFSIL
jgi:hypothetical protein